MVWYDSDYSYKKKITIDHTKVGGDEIDFPVLVSVTDNDLRDDLNSGHVESANGYDIIFTNSAETVQLKHEIEKYTDTSGLLIYWVKVSSLSSTVDTDIYIYYGKAGVVVDPSTTDTWDSDFMAVWHMNSLLDSTSNNIDMTNYGADLTVDGGKIGDCYRFIEANNDYMLHATFLDVMPASDELTLETWAYFESDPGLDQHMISKTNQDGDDRFAFRRQATTDYLQMFAEGTAGGNDFATDNDAAIDDTWQHCVTTYEAAAALRVIHNGTDITVGDVCPEIRNGTDQEFAIGCFSNAYPDYRYEVDGYLDEVRVSSVVRSDNWISTTYETQSTPTLFMSWGAEEIISHTPSDTVDISDSIIFKHKLNLSDTLTIQESILLKHYVTLADNISISDNMVSFLKTIVELSDSINIDDIIASKHTFNPTDAINISDIVAFEHLLSLIDNITISDSIMLAIRRIAGIHYITFKQTISKTYTNFLPNATGCHTDLTPVGEANNWQCVDDPVATPDEDTTYVHSNATILNYDLYGLPNHTTENDAPNTINYIQVYARAKSHELVQHADGTFKIILTDNNCTNIYKSDDIDLTTNYATNSNSWAENPRTLIEWTWDDFDNLQAGVECSSPSIPVENPVPVTFRPSAAGDVTQLNPSPAVANYLNVDEVVKDDGTTVVRAYTDDEGTLYDLYNLPNHTTETEPITRIVVYAWVFANDTKAGEAETVIKIGGNTYYGDNPVQTKQEWKLISTEYLLNPDTAAAWTWDNIDDLQAGILLNEPEAPDTYNYCTQVYVEVYYSEEENPEIRATQCYAKVNYSTHYNMIAPENVSTDHAQNIKEMNMWNGERIVFGESRSKWSLLLKGRDWENDACDKILAIKQLGLDGLPLVISGLDNPNWDTEWMIKSVGWKLVYEKPLHYEWIILLEKT